MRKITKANVLANIGGGFKPFGQICVEMAMTMQRAINVNDVKVLLMALVRDGRVETTERDNRLYYRKT